MVEVRECWGGEDMRWRGGEVDMEGMWWRVEIFGERVI